MFRQEKGNDIVESAFYGKETQVKKLIDAKANIEDRDYVGRTALHWAAFKGYTSVVKLLLDERANINSTDPDGETPILKAAFSSAKNSADIIKLLLKKGADLTLKTRNFSSILEQCRVHGSEEAKKVIETYQHELNQIKLALPLLIEEQQFPKDISILVSQYLDSFSFFNEKNSPSPILKSALENNGPAEKKRRV